MEAVGPPHKAEATKTPQSLFLPYTRSLQDYAKHFGNDLLAYLGNPDDQDAKAKFHSFVEQCVKMKPKPAQAGTPAATSVGTQLRAPATTTPAKGKGKAKGGVDEEE
jgi:hypothetical protein